MCVSQCFFSALKSSIIIIIKDGIVIKKNTLIKPVPPSDHRRAKRSPCIATGTVFNVPSGVGGGPVRPHRHLVHRVLLLYSSNHQAGDARAPL